MDALKGGKAKGLQKLRELGMPVPDFYEWNTASVISKLSGPEEPELLLAILKEKLNFPDQALIVRSNLAIEDGDSASFAGIFDSVLSVQNRDELFTAMAQVSQSYRSERALFYAQEHGLHISDADSFLFQQFIETDYSGVALSTFPEFPDEIAIHLIEGRGDALVQGAAEGIELNYCRRRREWIHPPPVSILSICDQLRDFIVHIEKQTGSPQDLEFGIRNGQIWFFQMRPITQSIPERIVLDNSNIQESYAGISLPLTFSFAKRAYAAVYTETMRAMRLPEKRILEYAPVVNELLYSYKGRIYYHIHNWYRGLLLLPSFSKNKADMEAMMGLDEPIDFIKDQSFGPIELFRRMPVLLLTYLRLWIKFRSLDEAAERFRAHFAAHFLEFYEREAENQDKQTLLRSFEALERNFLRKWSVPILNDFYVMMLNGQLNRKWAGEKLPAKEIINRLLSRDMQIESMAPNQFYEQLAEQLQSDERFIQRLRSGERMHEWMEENRPENFQQIRSFIHQYGDRTVGELKMETETLRLNPELFYPLLANYLMAGPKRKKAEESDLNQYAHQKLFQKLKRAIERREALRMDRTRLFGMYRSIFCRTGNWMAREKRLREPSDIFYLNMDEIIDYLNDAGERNYVDLVNARKSLYANYAKLEVPGRVILPHRLQTSFAQMEGDLIGQVVLGESLQGEAVVYRMNGPVPDLRGKILCAPRTDPGWVPLFPACKAVLIEKGSSLSHSVIVLREMGIPCMINIPGLTQRIESGMILHLDFESGKIKAVKNE
ncbi:MAG TPA: hypothetical protein DIW47_12235 [Bacteroidetes bacterium]|nr:hypothetical protein [Bacteroidota bacterium]